MDCIAWWFENLMTSLDALLGFVIHLLCSFQLHHSYFRSDLPPSTINKHPTPAIFSSTLFSSLPCTHPSPSSNPNHASANDVTLVKHLTQRFGMRGGRGPRGRIMVKMLWPRMGIGELVVGFVGVKGWRRAKCSEKRAHGRGLGVGIRGHRSFDPALGGIREEGARWAVGRELDDPALGTSRRGMPVTLMIQRYGRTCRELVGRSDHLFHEGGCDVSIAFCCKRSFSVLFCASKMPTAISRGTISGRPASKLVRDLMTPDSRLVPPKTPSLRPVLPARREGNACRERIVLG